MNKITEKQKSYLMLYLKESFIDTLSKEEASKLISEIIEN
jgi:hypothetical protein